ncbi:BPTI/Kunitz domain-containing protein-like [Daphnia pulex]|uniref:BPTI/Kunitz domain-containing protein-like n=1 Tax=Daphnia pulex TaxID=6669 RepID=UPI001EDEC053|nr:BPTI/Kunitz domain-containing protein-like [Daphnia pulex]
MLKPSGKVVLLFCVIAVGARPQPNPIVNETNSVVILTKGEMCSLPPVDPSNISCFAFIPSWTFNSALGRCQSFVYGGCGRTANLFDTQNECNAACGSESNSGQPISKSACLKPKVTGPCRAAIPSFFFDATTGVCTPFNYGGCGGNDNRFTTEKACQLACSAATNSEENN